MSEIQEYSVGQKQLTSYCNVKKHGIPLISSYIQTIEFPYRQHSQHLHVMIIASFLQITERNQKKRIRWVDLVDKNAGNLRILRWKETTTSRTIQTSSGGYQILSQILTFSLQLYIIDFSYRKCSQQLECIVCRSNLYIRDFSDSKALANQFKYVNNLNLQLTNRRKVI